jgi:hypothetical protein
VLRKLVRQCNSSDSESIDNPLSFGSCHEASLHLSVAYVKQALNITFAETTAMNSISMVVAAGGDQIMTTGGLDGTLELWEKAESNAQNSVALGPEHGTRDNRLCHVQAKVHTYHAFVLGHLNRQQQLQLSKKRKDKDSKKKTKKKKGKRKQQKKARKGQKKETKNHPLKQREKSSVVGVQPVLLQAIAALHQSVVLLGSIICKSKKASKNRAGAKPGYKSRYQQLVESERDAVLRRLLRLGMSEAARLSALQSHLFRQNDMNANGMNVLAFELLMAT